MARDRGVTDGIPPEQRIAGPIEGEVRLARVNDHNGSCLVALLSVPVLDPNMHNPTSVLATRLLRVCLASFAAFGLVVVPAVPAAAQQSADPRPTAKCEGQS